MLYFLLKHINPKSLRLKYLGWLPLIIWVCIILGLSFSSFDQAAKYDIPGIDKVAHFGMFFVLALLAIIQVKRKRLTILNVVVFSIFLAAITELVQHFFIDNRHGNWLDFLSNLAGLGSGIFLMQHKIKT